MKIKSAKYTEHIEGLVQNYLTSYIKWGSYNSFAPSPRYINDGFVLFCSMYNKFS